MMAHHGWFVIALHGHPAASVFLSLTVDASMPPRIDPAHENKPSRISLTPPPSAGGRYHVPGFVYALFHAWLSISLWLVRQGETTTSPPEAQCFTP